MSLWEANIRDVEPYVPGEQPKMTSVIKLNTNENPYPPSPEVRKVIEKFDYSLLRKYPDPEASMLVDSISDFYGVEPDNVFVGVGSDDVLSMCFLTFFNSKAPVLIPDITYSFYEVWGRCYGTNIIEIPLKDDFTLDETGFDRECCGILIPNPNAPTSLYEPKETFSAMAEKHPEAVVIVDEAYIDYGGESALSLTGKYDNILVVRTFSKSRSLAGSRIGFAIGSKKLISALNRVKFSINSYTIDSLTMAIGKAAMDDRKYFEDTVEKIIRTRTRTKKELEDLGFSVLDSKSNFLFVTHPEMDAADTNAALKDAGIYVRYFPTDRIKDYLRITIGTDDEMDKLISSFKKRLFD